MFGFSSVLGGSCVGCERDAIKGAEQVIEEGRAWTRSEKEVVIFQDRQEKKFNPESVRFRDGKRAEEWMRGEIEAELWLKQAQEKQRLSTLEGKHAEFERLRRVREDSSGPEGIRELEKSRNKVHDWMDKNFDSDHPPALQ